MNVKSVEEAKLIRPIPPGSRRKLISVFITVFLLIQIVAPLTYYIRGEPTSERFAWRMFSSIHMSDWDCRIIETVEIDGKHEDRDVAFDAIVEESTAAGLRAGQLDIAEKFLRGWCSREGVVRVRYSCRGVAPSGTDWEPIDLVIERFDGQLRRVSANG